MDFWTHQDRAKASSFRFVALFLLAVVAVVGAVDAVAWGILHYADAKGWEHSPSWRILGGISAALVALIAIGSGVKWLQLRQGGPAIASMLGARPVNRSQPKERRLQDVVEEMSIASGHPPPAVYVMEQGGINAFAAGLGANDAVVAVTTGALEELTRDELQGVVAHEFSHLAHGDARLNLKLVCWLHGLLVIVLLGRLLMETVGRGQLRSRDNKNDITPILLVAGVVLIAVGGIGWLVASLLRSAVSRQREFLADAAGAQYTRNPAALASALARIRGHGDGSGLIASAHAPEASHFFFVRALTPFQDLFGSHPPLTERINRLDPGWDAQGKRPPSNTPQFQGIPQRSPGQVDQAKRAGPSAELPGMIGIPLPAVAAGLAGAGPRGQPRPPAITPDRVAFARHLLASLPSTLTDAAAEPFSARAVVLAMLIEGDPADALARIRRREPGLSTVTAQLVPVWRRLPADRARLPLMQLCLGALRALTPGQRHDLLVVTAEVAASDGKVTFADTILLGLLRSSLRQQPRTGSDYATWTAVEPDAALVMDAVSRAAGAEFADQAWRTGIAQLGHPLPRPLGDIDAQRLVQAMDRLTRCSSAMRRALVLAAAHAVAADGEVRPKEAELLHLIASALECPLPPFAAA